jgi:hypothetical protein
MNSVVVSSADWRSVQAAMSFVATTSITRALVSEPHTPGLHYRRVPSIAFSATGECPARLHSPFRARAARGAHGDAAIPRHPRLVERSVAGYVGSPCTDRWQPGAYLGMSPILHASRAPWFRRGPRSEAVAAASSTSADLHRNSAIASVALRSPSKPPPDECFVDGSILSSATSRTTKAVVSDAAVRRAHHA